MLTDRPSIEELEDVFLPDCAEEAMRDAPAMQERCRHCPGRLGTEASANPITVSLLSDCKRRRFPFMCHMTRTRNDLCSHLCADWVAAITGRAALQEKEAGE